MLLSIGIAACGSDRTLSEEATSEEEVETAVSSEAEDYEATPALSDEQDIAVYDYRFYLQGIYLSSDGSDDKIYIKPVEFVHYANEEHRKKYNIPENESGSYEIIESTDEVIALPLSEETEFHIINWHKSQELADHSLNHDLQGIVALDDPLYFFKWMSEDYGDWLAKYPLCLYLNEDGTVERVIELWLP